MAMRREARTHEETLHVRQVLLVASTGGHLAQLMSLKPWWETRQRAWVTFDKPDARSLLSGEVVDYAYHPTTRNVFNLCRNMVVAVRVLRRRRPDLIVSTGAGVAIPFFVLAWIIGIRSVYIEVYDRLTSRTVTGRLCRPLSSAFAVQWDEQQGLYPGSQVIGPLL